MCGIAFIMRKDGHVATKQLIRAYEKQRTRGTQGFGYVAFTKGEVEDVYRSANETDVYKSLKSLKSESIMFHHRFPTSTPNFKEGAHPIHVSNPRLKYDYYVIHNGVITNDDALKTKHEALGYKYTTEMFKLEMWKTRDTEYFEAGKVTKFNDSESLAIELSEGIESNAVSIGAYGSQAFICIQADKDDGDNNIKIHNIFYGRNTNPLMIEDNNNFLKLSSENGREMIDAHTLYTVHMDTGITTQRKCVFGSDYVYVPTKKEIVPGHLKDGKWIPPYEKEETPRLFMGYRDANEEYDDYARENARIDAQLKKQELDRILDIEQSLDNGLPKEDIIESILTGRETYEELLTIRENAEDKIGEYDSKGQVDLSNEMWLILDEVEEAISEFEEDVKLNRALDKIEHGGVQYPPDYREYLQG